MYPQTNLQPGQSGPEVKKLQEFLISQGYAIPSGPTSYFGNETKAALTSWQKEQGVDAGGSFGYWGPKSQSVASGAGASSMSGTGQVTQADIDRLTEEVLAETKNNSITSALLAKGNTAEDLLYATTTGDLSKLTDFTGQPFSLQDQQTAMAEAEKDLEGFYKAEAEKDKADTEEAIKGKQRAFQDYLITSGENFAEDKTAADQTSANQGVLFSGSRVQKEQDLKTKYERDLASKRAGVASEIGTTARDFQYKYGGDAASSLSDYYKLGDNTYNPKVATGGVTSGGLSSIYTPGQYDFQGTKLAEKKSAAAKRAAGLLANRGNKLLSTSYANQL